MCKRLPNSNALTIDHDADQPVTGPPEIAYHRMLELSVTIRADDQQVTWVMADLWIKVV